MPSPPSVRKRPHCHTCMLPMAGHKRQGGSPVCPDNKTTLPLSPPMSPPHSIKQRDSATPRLTTDENFISPLRPSFVIPESGYWHHRNPNWVDPPPPRPPSPAGSFDPTVLVDEDGNTVHNSDHESDSEPADDDDDDNGDPRAAALDTLAKEIAEHSKPIVSILGTSSKDIARIYENVLRMGAYASVVHNPSESPGGGRLPRPPLAREHSWWLVVGQDVGLVENIVETQQKAMPGAIIRDRTLVESAGSAIFLQLIFAGVIGGCIVAYGLSLL